MSRVLRGPQGTLFGAGAEGGVVRFIAPEPNLKDPSALCARRCSRPPTAVHQATRAGSHLARPIIDDVLAFRVSVSFRRDGGWVDRSGYTLSPPGAAATVSGALTPTPVPDGDITSPNANWQETTTARLALKWKVNGRIGDLAVCLLSAPADQRHLSLLAAAVAAIE